MGNSTGPNTADALPEFAATLHLPSHTVPRMKSCHLSSGKNLHKSEIGAQAIGALATGTQAIGSLVLGAMAVGALAAGAVAIGRLAIGRARIRRLEIDELVVRRLVITEELQAPQVTDAASSTSQEHGPDDLPGAPIP